MEELLFSDHNCNVHKPTVGKGPGKSESSHRVVNGQCWLGSHFFNTLHASKVAKQCL